MLLGPQAGMAMMGDGREGNSVADMASLQKMLADTKAANRTPNGRVARGFDQFGPTPFPQGSDPMTAGGPSATGAAVPSTEPPPALSPQAIPPAASAPAPVTMPMPAPRPPEAPQASPEMGFFERNSAMMQDPSSGSFIDPEAAARAQASGPDVIQKLLTMFHNKA
jgi:hypothetical protein